MIFFFKKISYFINLPFFCGTVSASKQHSEAQGGDLRGEHGGQLSTAARFHGTWGTEGHSPVLH